MIKNIDIDLEFQEVIPCPPRTPQDLFNQSCAADEVTITSWRDVWISQIKENHKISGGFAKDGVGLLFQKYLGKPVIICGSGPGLKNSIQKSYVNEAGEVVECDSLHNTKGIPIVSCLHNFHFMEDNGINVDYYVTLDAGPITIKEISEGGAKTEEEYLEISKNKTLVAFIGSNPELIKKWRGKIYWFNSPVPDQVVIDAIKETEPFHTYISTGGNVLGACFYLAKAILGAGSIIFTGADFSFSYTKKFHGWNSSYDKSIGNCIRATDIYGNKVLTWLSYYNFKCWFDSRFCVVPGIYINATESGILGAYTEGNISQIKQMYLRDVIRMYSLSEELRAQCSDSTLNDRKVLF